MNSLILTIEKFKGQTLKAYKLDVSIEKDVINIFKKIINEYNNIDVLINNAGITSDNLLITMKTEQWNNVINTNLNGCYYCSKAITKQMIKQKSGKIINISSIIGQVGNKGQSNYAASKAGIIGLTKSLAKELASRKINVNAINPGYINTQMTKNLSNKDEFLNNIPLNRYGEPADVAYLACFLASEKSNYITGQTINVDGGLIM
jgi:3-oxoacyl-[acyl-carrier protein] reductase